MATFIKKRAFRARDEDDNIVEGFRSWTDEELLDLIAADPSSFFSVPESHADNVLRRQRHYQEVLGDVLETYSATVLGRGNVPAPAQEGVSADQGSADSDAEDVESGSLTTDEGEVPDSAGGVATATSGAREPEIAGAESSEMDAGGERNEPPARAAADKHRAGESRRRHRSGKGSR